MLSSRTALLASATLASLALALAAAGCGGSERDAVPPSAIRLTSSGSLPPNAAIASIALFDTGAGVAIMNNSNFPPDPRPEVLIPFSPLSGAVGASVSAQAVITTATALPDENGAMLTSWTTAFPAFAAAASGKLYVTTSNSPPPTFAFQPGSVLVHDYDRKSGAIGAARTPVITVHGGKVFYNPTWIGSFQRASGGTRLAVVCSGTFGFGAAPSEGAVLVIDPATDTITEAVTFASRTVSSGEAVISADNRLYVGGSGFGGAPDAVLFVIDLSSAPPTVRHGEANPISLPTQSNAQNIGDLALSADQKRLFALNFNDGALHVLARDGAGTPDTPSHVVRVAAMKRGATGANADFKNNAQSLAVRPGFPGLEYTGPDVIVGTINVSANAQVLSDVETSVDLVTTNGLVTPVVKLDALVAPFQVFDDIQHMSILKVGQDRGFLYVAQVKSGVLVVADLDLIK